TCSGSFLSWDPRLRHPTHFVERGRCSAARVTPLATGSEEARLRFFGRCRRCLSPCFLLPQPASLRPLAKRAFMAIYAPPPVWGFAPFVFLPLLIAVFPLNHVVSHWWERNTNKLIISFLFAPATLAFYALIHPIRDPHKQGALLRGVPAVS